MRKPCKNKRCLNLAVAGGAYCLNCRHRRRQLRARHAVCKDWSIYALPNDISNPNAGHSSAMGVAAIAESVEADVVVGPIGDGHEGEVLLAAVNV